MSNDTFKLDVSGFEELQQAMKNYQGDVEEAINEVLHKEAGPMIQEAVMGLMPKSTVKEWKGKLPHAKNSKSTVIATGNLFVEVKSAKKYQYLYFPDDGSSTKKHIGNQHFFKRGGESRQDEIIRRCIGRLQEDFDNII